MTARTTGLAAIGDAAAGPRALALGFSLIFRRGIRVFVIVPLVINVVVFVALGAWLGERWHDWVERMVSTLPGWLQWLEAIAWVLFAILFVLVFAYGFTFLANLIASPFNGFLSERVERYYGGRPGSGRSVVGEAFDGVVTAIRTLAFIASRALLLGLVSLVLLFIPVVNALIPLLWLIFGMYTLALEYFDYPMSNHGYGFDAKRRWLRDNRVLTLSFGGSTVVLTALPLINLIIMPAAVAGATALWVERMRGTDGLSD